MNRYILLIAFMISSTLFSSTTYAQSFENIQVKANIRKANKGKLQHLSMTTYYDIGGKMVSIYDKPDNITIINNEKGSVSIYDSNNNSVVQSDNPYYSTKTNELYYFLKNKKDDLGISEMGFKVKNTVFEDGFIVTTWTPPTEGQTYFSSIKLVHQDYNPIYVEYKDVNDQIIKKLYFAAYRTENYIDLPMVITSIDFITQSDSIVTKVTYNDVIFDTSETSEKLNFEIPSDAKLIK